VLPNTQESRLSVAWSVKLSPANTVSSLSRYDGIFYAMLTPEETRFLAYWKTQREKPKRAASRLTSGLPLGVGIVVAVFISLLSGWNKQASAVLRTHGSVIVMVLLASVVIVVFLSIFSAHHEWDQHEERYQALLQKQKAEAASSD
jgi:hypothetical protein